MKTISVGSLNPVKIKAVESAVHKIWPEAVVTPISVKSGVSDQPMSDEEIIQGAINRARNSLKETNSDLGIGLEGGVIDSDRGMFLSGRVAVIDKNGNIGIGGGGGLLLPEKVAREVRVGKELGPVMDELIGDHNTKQKKEQLVSLLIT